MIFLQLFFSFFKLGFISFGGGYAAISLIHDEVVSSHNWLSVAEYLDILALSQMTPGPIAINTATFVGYRIAGIWGSVVATTSIVLPSFILVFIIILLHKRFNTSKRFDNSIHSAVVILIFTAGIKVGLSILSDYFDAFQLVNVSQLIIFILISLLVFVLLNVEKKKIKIYWIVLAAGFSSMLLNFIL